MDLMNIPLPAIKTTYHVLLYFEIFLHMLGFIVSAAFLSKFSNLRSVHVNLRWIFASFVLAACTTSIWRIYYCLLLLVLDADAEDDILDLSSSLRKTCVYATGLHLFLLAAERQFATARSQSYENERHVALVCATIIVLWGFSYLVVSCLKSLETARDFIASFIFSAVYGISIMLMLHVRRSNLVRWKKNRGTLQFSQSYQVRENVKSATYLYKCFLVFSVQTIVGWSSLSGYLVFRKIFKVFILEKLFGFVFDVSVALLTTTIPLTIVKHNEKLKEQFRVLRKKICSSKKPAEVLTVGALVDFEGRRVNVETREESAAYFSQFKEA